MPSPLTPGQGLQVPHPLASQRTPILGIGCLVQNQLTAEGTDTGEKCLPEMGTEGRSCWPEPLAWLDGRGQSWHGPSPLPLWPGPFSPTQPLDPGQSPCS